MEGQTQIRSDEGPPPGSGKRRDTAVSASTEFDP